MKPTVRIAQLESLIWGAKTQVERNPYIRELRQLDPKNKVVSAYAKGGKFYQEPQSEVPVRRRTAID